MVLKSKEKKEISRRYHREDQTIDEISKDMKISPTTVSKYKNYGLDPAPASTKHIEQDATKHVAPSVTPKESVPIAPVTTPTQAHSVEQVAAAPPVYNKQPFWEHPVTAPRDDTQPPAWAEELMNKVNSLEEQIDNNVVRSANPPLATQQQRITSEKTNPETWFRNFLARYRIKPSAIELLIGEARRYGLPTREQLHSDLLNMNSGLQNITDLRILAENYGYEKFEAWDSQPAAYETTPQQLNVMPSQVVTQNPVVPSSNVSHQPISQQQQYVPTFQQQLLEFFNLADRVNIMRNPESQSTSQAIAQQISDIFDKKELSDFRSGRFRNVTENDVSMEETKEKYKLENKKLEDANALKANIYEKIGIILSAIPGAIGMTQQELMAQAGLPPDSVENPPTPDMQYLPPKPEMLNVPCPFCNGIITFPKGTQRIVCINCGHQLRAEYTGQGLPPEQQQVSEEPIPSTIPSPLHDDRVEIPPTIKQLPEEPSYPIKPVEEPVKVEELPVESTPVLPENKISLPEEPIEPGIQERGVVREEIATVSPPSPPNEKPPELEKKIEPGEEIISVNGDIAAKANNDSIPAKKKSKKKVKSK